MIKLSNVSKRYRTHDGFQTVLDNVSLEVGRGEKVGILGRNGAGKSTLVRLISGAELPDSGAVARSMTVSWPIAFGGAFQGSLTGVDNLRFICRVYGVDPEDKVSFVEEFSELGRYMREPVKTYSSGMRARLAFALSMVIEFECFLIDEVVSVGDDRFRDKCQLELFEKRRDRAMIIVSHNFNYLREHCQNIVLLHNAKVTSFDDVEEAYRVYSAQTQFHPN